MQAATEGVYVGWAAIADPSLPPDASGSKIHKAVLSIGWNPQFDDVKERTIEAYLVHDFGGRDFYDQEMRLLICAFLRPQEKFESFDALIEAITTDVSFGTAALDAPELLAFRDDPFFSGAAPEEPAAEKQEL